jgi:DNA-binding NtrC family response regulator
LRILETGEFRPVGSEKAMKVDVRVVAATNRNLDKEVEQGRFRKDLFYRLNVLKLEMPPLREHREDIPALAEHFLSLLRSRVATPADRFSSQALDLLKAHDWPGNVRELKNAIERSLYVCDGEEILSEHLVGLEEDGRSEDLDDVPASEAGPLDQEIERLERSRIAEVLERHRWNRSRAAAELGIARKTLLAKIRKYGL